jgi:putative flippase GtrA
LTDAMLSGVGRQFLRFCLVGGVGFVVDAGILLLLIGVGLDRYSGRVLSYLAAATVTWLLNRRYTFTDAMARPLHRQWAHYVGVNAIGAAVNYLVYAGCLLASGTFYDRPVLAVAAGSAVALLFNFAANRYLVFRRA